MKHIYKCAAAAIAAIALILSLAGCTSSMSYTFEIADCDAIKVTLDTSDGYSIGETDGVFYISENEEILTSGIFMAKDDYEQYFQNVPDAEGTKLLEKDSKNGNEYIFYRYDDGSVVNYYYIIKIAGTDTGVGLINSISENCARLCFEKLTIEAA